MEILYNVLLQTVLKYLLIIINLFIKLFNFNLNIYYFVYCQRFSQKLKIPLVSKILITGNHILYYLAHYRLNYNTLYLLNDLKVDNIN